MCVQSQLCSTQLLEPLGLHRHVHFVSQWAGHLLACLLLFFTTALFACAAGLTICQVKQMHATDITDQVQLNDASGHA